MKKYRVKVNGTVYEVEIEEMSAAEAAASKTEAIQASAPAAPQASAAAPAGGTQITSPMPGNILDVRVVEGQSVKKGDVLFILEAMKMENEIMAPCDGKVSGIGVQKGASVETSALLCTIV